MQAEKISEEAITYLIMLSAFQVVLNCQLELEGTKYLSGKSKIKVREAVNILNLEHSKNQKAIWNVDSLQAAGLMRGIEIIAKEIAQGDGVALSAISELLRKGFDLKRCKIIELSDEELEEYKKTVDKAV